MCRSIFKARYCPYCKEHGTTKYVPDTRRYAFYYLNGLMSDEDRKCKYCNNLMVNMNMTIEEFSTVIDISGDSDFIDAMDALKANDIIEFNLKMSQFREQVAKAKEEKERNVPKCPTCGSTDIKPISDTERMASVLGFGAFSKKINKTYKCLNCKCTW